MQEWKKTGPKSRKVRPQVVPKRHMRPHMLRKAERFCLHSSLVRISLLTRKSITIPENTRMARIVKLVKQWASKALWVCFIQHLETPNSLREGKANNHKEDDLNVRIRFQLIQLCLKHLFQHPTITSRPAPGTLYQDNWLGMFVV